MNNIDPTGLDGATAGNTADPLVESLKIESSELKADLQQRLVGKDSKIYKDTLEELQSKTPTMLWNLVSAPSSLRSKGKMSKVRVDITDPVHETVATNR